MFLTIIKQSSAGQQPSDIEKVTNIQKLIVSTALHRFSPFQHVLLPLCSRTQILCQIIKAPDMHEHFCYLNSNVVSVERVIGGYQNEHRENTKTVTDNAELSRTNDQQELTHQGFKGNEHSVTDEVNKEFSEDKNSTNKDLKKTSVKAEQFDVDKSDVEKLNVFKEFCGNKIDVDSIVELGDEVEHCKRLNVTVVAKKFYRGSHEEFSRVVKQILTMYTFTPRCFIRVDLENIHSIIVHNAVPFPHKGNKKPQQTDIHIESTLSHAENRPVSKIPTSDDVQCLTEARTISEKSTLVNAKISPTLLFVSPKTKLTVQATYSVEYYKQFLRFENDSSCVDEYVQYNETWRSMKQLIECRKRGLASRDRNRLNSANKILLTGLSGSGKTYLIQTVTRALSVPLVTVSGNEFSAPTPGVAEQSLAQTLSHARAMAVENKGLCVLLFEQIHELVPLSSSLSHIIRLSLSLTRALDSEPPDSPLFVVFTSTAAHSIDSRLKTHAHLYLTAPDDNLRKSILQMELAPVLGETSAAFSQDCDHSCLPKESISTTTQLGVEKSIHERSINLGLICERLIKEVVEVTGSYLPVDLIRVARVVMMFVSRHPEFTEGALIGHVRNFIAHYRPSCLKAGGLGIIDLQSNSCQATSEGEEKLLETDGAGRRESITQGEQCAPSTSVESEEFLPELGGLREVRAQLERKVEWPFKHAAAFERLGIPRPKGILLYGPPGCAKTSLVRELALPSSCRVLAVSAAQLYSPYVGEAEANVAQVFHRARTAAPAILFIDEIDALVGNRNEVSTKDVQQSVLSVFLNEMDGVGVKPELGIKNSKQGSGVLVIAATNRPTALDSAILRPGRLDTLIYVRPPDERERQEVLGLVSARGKMASDVDLNALAAHTELYSGADLTHLYREAALLSLLDRGFDNAEITQAHWMQALNVTRASLTQTQLKYYEDFECSM